MKKCDVLGVNDTPRIHLKKLESLIPHLEEKLKEAQKRVDDYVDKYEVRICKYLSKLEELNLYDQIRTKALQYSKSFIIVGWVPTEDAKPLRRRLKKLPASM